ncbi:MAG: Holliday junction resolvase RuvX [Proteobacteria bacterium]|nr:Holliday junction resolvase RuvX [Pseudomonadota bacterium]
MIYETAEDLFRDLPKGSRLLGVDVGKKTLGLAIANSDLTIASPLTTIRRKKLSLDLIELKNQIDQYQAGGLILGLPVSMDGTEGPACQSVRQFARDATEAIDIGLAFWDERLSTAAIQRLLVDEADMSRRRRADVVDKMAAAYILQGALDAWAHKNRS